MSNFKPNRVVHCLAALAGGVLLWTSGAAAAGVPQFVQKHCVECHDVDTKKED